MQGLKTDAIVIQAPFVEVVAIQVSV